MNVSGREKLASFLMGNNDYGKITDGLFMGILTVMSNITPKITPK
jgi:hypothetical protein